MPRPTSLTPSGSFAEFARLAEDARRERHWKRWGPYLSERQWGTVREDYSADGTAWRSFPHEQARFRAYRWGEDGLAGLSDRRQRICFALALWNGRDALLKERLFGLDSLEGNHAEDVKEYYFYLDSTPTHSYMRWLYRYPQAAYPYEQLVEGNRRRDRRAPEYELLDTGVFDEDRYFDVCVEYGKASPDDLLARIEIINRGPDLAELDVLPTVWFRNTWSWHDAGPRPSLREGTGARHAASVELTDTPYGRRWLVCHGAPELLFTENETNHRRLSGDANGPRYVKDAFHDYVVGGLRVAVNPMRAGTKAAARYRLAIPGGGMAVLRLRLTDIDPAAHAPLSDDGVDALIAGRRAEADAFYAAVLPEGLSAEAAGVARQAFAGLLWTKQFYHYDVVRWLEGDPAGPAPPRERLRGRNHHWVHLYNDDVISMPDKWEFPWYAAWDLAFHCVPLALVDPTFAKEQLVLFLREWYMHPNGQLPAYEWAFEDVNPPVHAWAAWRVYKIEKKWHGRADRAFLERVFHKLLLNFTWWVNRKDAGGRNVFEGGFLGLDNIGIFDRSAPPLAGGGRLEQSDATSWMGMYCLNMLAIALELARENPVYEDVASKFFEHFVYICDAMNHVGGTSLSLWDDEDGFYYDILHLPDNSSQRLRVRSMVGLIPLFAVETLSPETIQRLPGFTRRMRWFMENRSEFSAHVDEQPSPDRAGYRLLSLVNRERLRAVLHYMLNEEEFLSPYGVRSLSRYHRAHPYTITIDGVSYGVGYEPGASQSSLFGGNSNWRGPVWFPVNFLIIESLQKFHYYLGDQFLVQCPARSGRWLTLGDVATELSNRLIRLFLRDAQGHRPLFGTHEKFQRDARWNEALLFHEYFDGDTGRGLGASHQTGWTALVAKLIHQSGA